jgi:ACS family hexuronate transporter-like MFS transporter
MANKRIYPWLLVSLLSFNFGVVYFDRNALNFLMPLVQPELHLSNREVGLLASALALSWALSGLLVGRLSDLLRRRKIILVVCAVIFSAASVLSGWVNSFAMLIAARLLMGLAEGGVMPITQALVASEVAPAHRGLAMGVAQCFGSNLLGNFLGPLAAVNFALAFGWRHAFYLAALPGLVAAVCLQWLVREPPAEPIVAQQAAASSLVASLSQRNVPVCIGMSILLVAFVVLFATFTPLYLVKVRGMDPSVMSWLMSMWGLASLFYAFAVPGASDRLGRKPIAVSMGLIAALLPLSMLLVEHALWPLFMMFALGAAVSGIFPLAMATIPSETVPNRELGTVLGLTMGLGEIIGGVFSPWIAGSIADAHGLRSTLWIMVGLSVAAGLLACFLNETAPRVLQGANRQAAPFSSASSRATSRP